MDTDNFGGLNFDQDDNLGDFNDEFFDDNIDDMELDNDIEINDNTFEDTQQQQQQQELNTEIIENINQIIDKQNQFQTAIGMIQHRTLRNSVDINNNKKATKQIEEDTVNVFVNTGFIRNHGTGIFGITKSSGKRIGHIIRNNETLANKNRDNLFVMNGSINRLHNIQSENNIMFNGLKQDINQINTVTEEQKDEYIAMKNKIDETFNKLNQIEQELSDINNINNTNNINNRPSLSVQQSPINSENGEIMSNNSNDSNHSNNSNSSNNSPSIYDNIAKRNSLEFILWFLKTEKDIAQNDNNGRYIECSKQISVKNISIFKDMRTVANIFIGSQDDAQCKFKVKYYLNPNVAGVALFIPTIFDTVKGYLYNNNDLKKDKKLWQHYESSQEQGKDFYSFVLLNKKNQIVQGIIDSNNWKHGTRYLAFLCVERTTDIDENNNGNNNIQINDDVDGEIESIQIQPH